MKRLVTLLLITLVTGAPMSRRATAQVKVTERAAETKAEPVVIPAPTESRLQWENHRLKSSNIGLQIEMLKRAQADEDKAADVVLDEMQKAIGDRYSPRLPKETGVLEFVLKEQKTAPASDSKLVLKEQKK